MCDVLQEAPSNRRWLYLVIFAVFVGGLLSLPSKMADAVIAAVLLVGGSWLGIWLLLPPKDIEKQRQYVEW